MKHTGKIGLLIVLAAVIVLGFFFLRQEEPVIWHEIPPRGQVAPSIPKLNHVLYLNEFFQDYESLKAVDETPAKKFKAGVTSLAVLQGEWHNDGDSILINGQTAAVKVWIPEGLITRHRLELLEVELNCSRRSKVEILEHSRVAKSPELLLHQFEVLAGRTGPDDSLKTLLVHLPGQFKGDEIIIRVTPLSTQNLRIRLGGVYLLNRSYKSIADMPQYGFFQYGINNLRRVKSMFMRAGSSMSYSIRIPEIKGNKERKERVIIDGYLGSAEGKLVIFDLWVNGKKQLSQRVTHRPAYFRFKVSPRQGQIKWRIDLKGAPDRVGVLGNVAFYRPFKIAEPKHVVYYLIDSLRADMGGEHRVARMIENRFKDGAVFTSAYANAARTEDSLPALFTGKYKFVLVEKDELTPFVPEKEVLLAEYFKGKGYVTAAFINNPCLEQSNCTQGFDFVDKCWLPLEQTALYPTEEKYKNLKYGHMELYIRDIVRRNKDKPLFLFIHTMEPHMPYEPPVSKRVHSRNTDKKVLEHLFRTVTLSPEHPLLEQPEKEHLRALKSLYKDQVILAEEFFGKIHDHLEEAGVIDKHSLTILSSDHGERFYEHRSWGHGAPDVYNEVLKIPMMIKGPGIEPGSYGYNVQLADIFPTIMAWMGDTPASWLVGQSLVGDNLKSHSRIIYSDGAGKKSMYSFIKGHMKVIIDGSNIRLYHLKNDPGETVDLSAQEEFRMLLEEAKTFRTALLRQKPLPN